MAVGGAMRLVGVGGVVGTLLAGAARRASSVDPVSALRSD